MSTSINSIDMRKRRPPVSRELLTAEVAASSLGVSRRTLYSYASRGLIGVSEKGVTGRGSLYDATDVGLLRERKERGRSQAAIAASTLSFGEPILETGLSRIENGRFSDRGHDAIEFAETGTLEEVAGLLWSMPQPSQTEETGFLASSATPEFMARCIGAVSNVVHLGKHDASPDVTWAEAARILYTVAGASCGAAGRWPAGTQVHKGFADYWGIDAAGSDLLRRCLVLMADHELSASTYAARIAASTGASLGACVLAALCALSGRRHGGAVDDVRALLAAPEVMGDPDGWARRFSRGAPKMVAGFGHRLYPDGDPRAAALLRFIGPDPEWRALASAMRSAVGLLPSTDAALVAIERHLRLPQFAANAVMTTARTVGWIAHVLEQRREGKLIRPRAVYVDRSDAVGG